ncbi:uncharacterized protein PADG_11502 [Paracoccidioides brasiliensis Pb18]|uniref:Uncharacterized protein n=1 Tax=Paracoccidioides brasiliensis (strain Pb18) TaxID=502780 RepID=A0A0A0HW93_PARBD|nr:uncharacterized protein PADG_11502 [Paracoccidioides brasiliensis Pb18]KGM92311.1 hypothetical protein PADG_11502 [Paracoccidioides brasiliensis Pb18]
MSNKSCIFAAYFQLGDVNTIPQLSSIEFEKRPEGGESLPGWRARDGRMPAWHPRNDTTSGAKWLVTHQANSNVIPKSDIFQPAIFAEESPSKYSESARPLFMQCCPDLEFSRHALQNIHRGGIILGNKQIMNWSESGNYRPLHVAREEPEFHPIRIISLGAFPGSFVTEHIAIYNRDIVYRHWVSSSTDPRMRKRTMLNIIGPSNLIRFEMRNLNTRKSETLLELVYLCDWMLP